jgi:hypothetical protein
VNASRGLLKPARGSNFAAEKAALWMEVGQRCLTAGFNEFHPLDLVHLRDSVFGKRRSQVLKKYGQSRKTGAAPVEFSQVYHLF